MGDRYVDALDFMRGARTLTRLADLEAQFLGVVSQFGFDRTICTLMAEPGKPIRPRLLFGVGDRANRQRYLDSGTQRIDPTFRAVFGSTRAFTWSDVEAQAVGDQARELFRAARRDGHEGLIVPVHGAYGEVTAVVLTGVEPQVDDQARAVLQACGVIYAVAGRQLLELEDDAPLTASRLTRRESQVLVWLSRGKTVPEIALILDVAVGTAKTHLERAKAKLGHQATVPTVLEAARRGWLVDPDEFA